MPDVARETTDHPPKRLMGYYDICQTPLFLATNGKRPVHLTYDFSLRQYVTNARTDGQTDGQTDERTDGQKQRLLPPSLRAGT